MGTGAEGLAFDLAAGAGSLGTAASVGGASVRLRRRRRAGIELRVFGALPPRLAQQLPIAAALGHRPLALLLELGFELGRLVLTLLTATPRVPGATA